MKPFRLDRRSVLRGAGSVAIALPWLEAMEPVRPARAQQLNAKRFVAVYTPGGTVPENFVPIGTTEAFTLSPILLPLGPVKDHLVVLQGVDMKCKNGEQHAAGMVAWLTGCKQVPEPGEAIGPSLDRTVAELFGTEVLYLAVRWGTPYLETTHRGVPNAWLSVSYATDGTQLVPQAPELDPADIWQKLFGTVEPGSGPGWRRSILDSVLGRYQRLSQRLGARDRQLLDQHLQRLRELEQGLSQLCTPPELVDTTGYNPRAFDVADAATDAAIPLVGKLMMDMLVAAMACDRVQVATLQWADSYAGHTLPWLELAGNRVQNFYEHNGGFQVAEMTSIFTWYASQHAYLLGEMAKVDMGGHSLLDESVVFVGSQESHPANHSNLDMPFLLAGGGGGLKGNRYRDYGGRSHNDLLSAILNLFGDPRTTFGDPAFCTQPLDNLTT